MKLGGEIQVEDSRALQDLQIREDTFPRNPLQKESASPLHWG